MKIYVIRHCEATGQSHDAPLTAKGFEQAESLADFLDNAGIERVISSPYLRAQQTIDPYVRRHKISVTLDSRLTERVLSNSNMENWLECLRETFENFNLSFEGGESNRHAMGRAVEVFKELQSCESKCIAIVTHGNLMTLLLRHFDARFGFNDWANLSNPDVFLLTVNSKTSVQRVWREVL